MRRRRALLCLLPLLLLSGCWDSHELEEANYVMAVGIDKGKREKLAVTFVLAGPHKVAAGGEEGGDKDGGDKGEGGDKGSTITVESPTLSGATFYLNTIIPRPSSLAQTKLILMSEELVRSEGMVVLDEATRSRNLRRSTMLVVTKQPVQKFLRSLPPGPAGLSDFAFIQTSGEARRSGFLPVRTSLNDFLIRASTAYQAPVAYYAAVAEKADDKEKGAQGGEAKPGEKAGKSEGKSEGESAGGEQKGGGGGGEAKSAKLVPGASPRKGGPTVDFFGTAAFRQTKMVGTLDAQDTRAMLLIQNSFGQSAIEVIDPHDPNRVGSVRLSTGRPTRVKARLVDGRPHFDITITLEGEVVGMPAVDYTIAERRDQLESQIAQDIKTQVETFFKKTQEWQSDVGGLGRYMVRKFPTVAAWEQFNWPDQYKDAQIQVNVRMQIRRFGVQLSPQSTQSQGRSK